MNYLALCQRLRMEIGATSGAGTGPVTVQNQVGEYGRLVTWIAQADLEIQEEHDSWYFLRKDVNFNTIAHQQAYAPTTDVGLTDFAQWKMDSFRAYRTAFGIGDENFVTEMPYNEFRDYYIFNTRRITYSRPISISKRFDLSLVIGPAPDDVYTVVGEYYRTPVQMTLDTDIPLYPARYHMACVYKAMMSYAMYESAPEVLTRAQLGYNTMLRGIESDQLAEVLQAGCLA